MGNSHFHSEKWGSDDSGEYRQISMYVIVFNVVYFICLRFFLPGNQNECCCMRESVLVLPGGKRRFCPATRRSSSLAELLDIKNTSIILHFINVVGMLNRGQIAGALLRYAGHR